jgi:hypothetical protein
MAPHHRVEQGTRKLLASSAEQFRPDILIQLFRVEHQSIQIEDDGMDGRIGGHQTVLGPWFLVLVVARISPPENAVVHLL